MNENDEDKAKGLYHKFNVTRTDGSSGPGGKHENCFCYVLDINHDPHAPVALRAYADSCRSDYPALAADLDAMVKQAAATVATELPRSIPIRVECPGHSKWHSPSDIRLLTNADGSLDYSLPCGCILDSVVIKPHHKEAMSKQKLTCCFCRVTDGTVETAKTGTPMHRQCLRDAALGSMEDSLFPIRTKVADLNDEDQGG